MADIVGYISVFFIVIISGAGLYPDFFTNTGKTARIILFVLLLAATISALYTMHAGNIQHAQDSARITQLQTAVKDGGDRQQKSAEQFIKGQKETTNIFVSKYDELSKRLSDLQTGIKTASLRQQVDSLNKALAATRNALVVPKAKLTFSLTNTRSPKLAESLPVKGGVVHVSFYVLNNGTVDALDGDVVLFICGDCSYAKESPPFVRIAGAPDNQRNFAFQRILAHSTTQLFEADIKVGQTDPWIDFGVTVICRTCETVPAGGHPLPNMIAHITLLRPQ